MKLLNHAKAGTLESGDVFITVTPGEELLIHLDSPVKEQFGDAIMDLVQKVLEEQEVTSGTIELSDQGALDCTIRARLITALERASKGDVS